MFRHPHLRSKLFDRVVFNFPHAGFFGKEDNAVVRKVANLSHTQNKRNKSDNSV
jgi:hypothetical protein